MAQLDGNPPVGPSAAESSGTRTTRVTRLPPPPVSGLRSVARLRGAFDESLPTLRLPTLPPQAKSDERGVAPRTGDTVIGRPMSPSAILRSGPRVLAQPVLRLRMGGPVPFDPIEIEGGLRDLVEDDEAEELDVGDLVDADADAADTLAGAIDPADTAVGPVDPGATLEGALDPDDTLEGEVLDAMPEWSAHGVPLVALVDPTPVVGVAPVAVPSPALLAHAIVEPGPDAPRSRAWKLAFALPILAVAVVAVAVVRVAWTGTSTSAAVASPTASWPSRQETPVVAPSPVVATASVVAPAPVVAPVPVAAPVVATASVVAPASVVASPSVVAPATVVAPAPVATAPVIAKAPSVPPAPELQRSSPAPVKPARTRARSRTSPARPRALAPTPAPTPVATSAPVVRPPSSAGTDAKALLREAERAYAEGRFATALHFADRSRAKAPDVKAARIAVLSACRIGQAKKAIAAFAALPASQRKNAREQCRQRGVELP